MSERSWWLRQYGVRVIAHLDKCRFMKHGSQGFVASSGLVPGAYAARPGSFWCAACPAYLLYIMGEGEYMDEFTGMGVIDLPLRVYGYALPRWLKHYAKDWERPVLRIVRDERLLIRDLLLHMSACPRTTGTENAVPHGGGITVNCHRYAAFLIRRLHTEEYGETNLPYCGALSMPYLDTAFVRTLRVLGVNYVIPAGMRTLTELVDLERTGAYTPPCN